MASWIPYFLAVSPTWKLKAITEVKRILSKYSPAEDSSSLLSRLSTIPPEAWEEEMPILDLCLRETIRIIFSSVLLRRNVGTSPGVHVQGKQVDCGGFLVYLPTEAHHNPDIFPEPFEYVHSTGTNKFLIISVDLTQDATLEAMVRHRPRLS